MREPGWKEGDRSGALGLVRGRGRVRRGGSGVRCDWLRDECPLIRVGRVGRARDAMVVKQSRVAGKCSHLWLVEYKSFLLEQAAHVFTYGRISCGCHESLWGGSTKVTQGWDICQQAFQKRRLG